MSGRFQDAGDSLEDAEVGVIEVILAGERRVSGFICVPWAKGAFAENFARGLCIGQRGVVFHCDVGSGGFERDPVKVEAERLLFLFFWNNREDGIQHEDFFDNDSRLFRSAVKAFRLFLIWSEFWPLAFGRDVDFHSVERDPANLLRHIKKASQFHFEAEMLH